jgi:hypothetical protein
MALFEAGSNTRADIFDRYTATTVIGAAALLDDLGLKSSSFINRCSDRKITRSSVRRLIGFFCSHRSCSFRLGRCWGFAPPTSNRYGGLCQQERTLGHSNRLYHSMRLRAVLSLEIDFHRRLLSGPAVRPQVVLQRSTCETDRIIRRAAMYYSFAYAVLPMGATLSLLTWQERGGHFHAVMFFILFTAVLYFTVVLFMKANVVVFFLTLLFAFIVARASFRSLVALGLAAVASLLLMQGLLGCYRDSSADTVTAADTLVVLGSARTVSSWNHVLSAEARVSISASAAESRSAPAQPGPSLDVVDAAARFVRSIIFRTAASLPYYVQIFSNPDERCGLESNSLPFLPRETCYPATKVGTLINPGKIQAFQSARAHVFAYAELGPAS